MDPKAITKDELYGVLDASTLEWTDGLFTHCVRKVIDNQRGEVTLPYSCIACMVSISHALFLFS